MSDLEAQIKAEQEEIENAPKIPVRQLQSGIKGRCSFCGKLAENLTLVDSMHGAERYRGECCGGNSY